VDLLVEFEPGKTPGLLRLAEIEFELSALLGGRRVDLRTPGDLSPYFRDEVLQNAELQYAAGRQGPYSSHDAAEAAQRFIANRQRAVWIDPPNP